MLAYVQVRIVKEKNTGKIMAMKKLKKSEMLRRGQVRGGAHTGAMTTRKRQVLLPEELF